MKYLETPIDECQDETVPKDWKSTGWHGDQVNDDIENIEEKSIGKLVLAVIQVLMRLSLLTELQKLRHLMIMTATMTDLVVDPGGLKPMKQSFEYVLMILNTVKVIIDANDVDVNAMTDIGQLMMIEELTGHARGKEGQEML